MDEINTVSDEITTATDALASVTGISPALLERISEALQAPEAPVWLTSGTVTEVFTYLAGALQDSAE